MGLKELLGEDLYKQVEEKLGENKIDIVEGPEAQGNWFPKSKWDEVNQTNKDLKSQLKERDKDLKDLSGKLKDNEDLQKEVKDWQDKYETAVKESDKKITQMRKKAAVEKALSGTKYPDLLIEKIDLDKLTVEDDKIIGLNDVVDGLKENYADLFGSKETPPGGGDDFKGGGGGGSKDLGELSMEEYIKARSKKD